MARFIIRSLMSAMLVVLSSRFSSAGLEADYTVYSYNLLFHSTGTVPESYGNVKELFMEEGALSLEPGNTFSILMNESSIQRLVYDMPENGLVYNAYTTGLERAQESAFGTFSAGPNNTIVVTTDGDSMTLFSDSSTNVLILAAGPETGTDFEEAGVGIIVRKSAGLSTNDLNGMYIRYAIGNANSGPTPRGWGHIDSLLMEQSAMSFDGAGNFTEQFSEWAAHRIISENIITNGTDYFVDSYCTVTTETNSNESTIGTYTVNPSNGTISLSFPDGSASAQVSPDGNLIVTGMAETNNASAGGYLNVAVKQPTAMPTNAIDAVFFSAEFEEEFDGQSPDAGSNRNSVELGRSYIYLRSDSTFFMRTDYWHLENTLENLRKEQEPNGLVSYNRFATLSLPRVVDLSSGTYSISANGEIWLMFNNGDVGMAQLSENGQYVVYGFYEGEEGYAERMMGFGIRRNAPPAVPTPVVFNSDFSMTSSGLVFSASVPTNAAIELLCTDDLTKSEWQSLGSTNVPNSNLLVNDPEASLKNARFYNATFGIW